MKIRFAVYALGVACCLLLSELRAQTITYSPTVMAQNMTITGAGSSPSLQSIVSLPISYPYVYRGRITSVERRTDTILGFSNATWPADAFNAQNDPHMVEVLSGDYRGMRLLISDTDWKTVTVSRPYAGVLKEDDWVRITPCLTLCEVFGDAPENAVVASGISIGAADEVSLPGREGSPAYFLFSYQDFHEWYDAGFNVVRHLPLLPSQAALVTRRQSEDSRFSIIGIMQDLAPIQVVAEGVNVLAYPGPGGLFLSDLSDTLDTGDPSTGLRSGFQMSDADEIMMISGGASMSYFFFEYGGFSGWFDALFRESDAVHIEPGQGFIYLRKGSPLVFSLE